MSFSPIYSGREPASVHVDLIEVQARTVIFLWLYRRPPAKLPRSAGTASMPGKPHLIMNWPSPPLFALTFLAAAAGLRGADASKVIWNNPVTFTEPGLSHHHFSSASMNREIGYCVWLPPGYEASNDRLPVIYFLHGTGGTESADAPAFSHELARRLASGSIPPVIAVFPNGGVSGYRDHPESGINVETMLVRELMPLIDETYRTRADRDSRVITGFSMGGGGAVRLALRYPGRFSAAASWAGAFVRGDGHGGFVPEFEISDAGAPQDRVRLLLIVGYDDLTYPWHAHAIDALQRSKYPFTLHLIDHLAHDLGRYYELTSDELIAFLTRNFPRPPKAH